MFICVRNIMCLILSFPTQILLLTISLLAAGAPYSNFRGPHYTVSNTEESRKHPYVEAFNSTYHGIGPREEARAMCSVKTHEVNATANATITKRLHGVVTSRELHHSIQRLELIIFGQMQQLWQSLDALRSELKGGVHSTYPDRRTIPLMFRYKPEGR